MPASDPAVFDALRDLTGEGPLELLVRGGCMDPRLRDGDRIVVAPQRIYWPGDVVAFRSLSGPLFVHRLLGPLRRAGTWWVLAQGDALSRPDEPVTWDQVLGRVRGGAQGPATTWPDRLGAGLRYLRHLARSLAGR
jgi:hypothetical protein